MPAHCYQKHEIKSSATTRVASPNLHPVVEINDSFSTDRIKFVSFGAGGAVPPVFAVGSSLAIANRKSTSETLFGYLKEQIDEDPFDSSGPCRF
jgi:hypothetical protein